MTAQDRRVVVIIPTYDERDSIPGALERLAEHVPAADILVVDDGSPDGTGDLVEKIAADETAAGSPRQIHVLHRTGKLGLGTAYVQGFGWALAHGYDTVVEMDADGSHRAEDLPLLLARSGDGELVIGSRWVRGGRVVNWPKHREVLSRGANLYARVLLGFGVHDGTAGFRAYDAQLLRRLPLDEVASHGYGFQIDMTWRAHQAGATIVEVPIVFVERVAGVSKMSGGIIGEAMVSVARWGLAHRARQLRSLFGGSSARRSTRS
jgi:dolichol-phosphate mannosyltransferase